MTRSVIAPSFSSGDTMLNSSELGMVSPELRPDTFCLHLEGRGRAQQPRFGKSSRIPRQHRQAWGLKVLT